MFWQNSSLAADVCNKQIIIKQICKIVIPQVAIPILFFAIWLATSSSTYY